MEAEIYIFQEADTNFMKWWATKDVSLDTYCNRPDAKDSVIDIQNETLEITLKFRNHAVNLLNKLLKHDNEKANYERLYNQKCKDFELLKKIAIAKGYDFTLFQYQRNSDF